MKEVLQYTSEFQPILFMKTRDIVPAKISGEKGVFDLGTVILIAFRMLGPSGKAKAAVRRSLLRAPCVKLAPSVYVFPDLKLRKYRKFESLILTPDRFLNLLDDFGLEARCIPRLRIVYPSGHKAIYEKMVENQIRSYDKIVALVRQIVKEADEARDVKTSLKRLSEARSRYNALKGVALFMFSYMNTDLRRYCTKTYKKINACKNLLDEKRLKRTVQRMRMISVKK